MKTEKLSSHVLSIIIFQIYHASLVAKVFVYTGMEMLRFTDIYAIIKKRMILADF